LQLVLKHTEFSVSRLHKERVYYVSEKIMKQAANVARENLVSLGISGFSLHYKGQSDDTELVCIRYAWKDYHKMNL
jgi:ribosome biogenesis protein Nip4